MAAYVESKAGFFAIAITVGLGARNGAISEQGAYVGINPQGQGVRDVRLLRVLGKEFFGCWAARLRVLSYLSGGNQRATILVIAAFFNRALLLKTDKGSDGVLPDSKMNESRLGGLRTATTQVSILGAGLSPASRLPPLSPVCEASAARRLRALLPVLAAGAYAKARIARHHVCGLLNLGAVARGSRRAPARKPCHFSIVQPSDTSNTEIR